jgi:hypothetical protein
MLATTETPCDRTTIQRAREAKRLPESANPLSRVTKFDRTYENRVLLGLNAGG